MLDMPIEELDLPMRAYNSLKRNNIVKVGQLLQLKDDDLLRMRNFGKKSLDEMKERLRMRGFIVPETESDGAFDDEDGEASRSTATRRPEPWPHRIDGRKLSRKRGPRLALYKNLTVSVLRYERVQTTEAKAKEIRGRVERMITLAKRGDLAARRTVVSEFPNEPLVVDKLFDVIAPKYADRTVRVHPARPHRPAQAAMRRRSSRSSWSRPSCSHERPRGLPPCATARGVNTTERTSPGSSSSRNARTVQGELEAALARLNGGERVAVDGAGRTDAGVHATGQVIAFTYPGDGCRRPGSSGRSTPCSRADVAIRDLRRAPAGFHPRYAARYREYRYTVWNGPRSPLRER